VVAEDADTVEGVIAQRNQVGIPQKHTNLCFICDVAGHIAKSCSKKIIAAEAQAFLTTEEHEEEERAFYSSRQVSTSIS
jgi:hypothetical protein